MSTIIEPQIIPCRHISEPMIVDGLLDEPAWREAERIEFLVPVTLETPISRTEACMLWDDRYLYVGFKAYDKDIWSYLTERDSPTCHEDCLEVFFKTDPDSEAYYNFEINALGTVYDAFNLKRGAGGAGIHRWKRWNCEGLKVGIHVEGTINDPSTVDEYWQMEVAIPFAELPTLKGRIPENGETWRFHLARYDYSIHLPQGVEISSCAPLPVADFHMHKDWIPLRFER